LDWIALLKDEVIAVGISPFFPSAPGSDGSELIRTVRLQAGRNYNFEFERAALAG
jgi:hypothetical protein